MIATAILAVMQAKLFLEKRATYGTLQQSHANNAPRAHQASMK